MSAALGWALAGGGLWALRATDPAAQRLQWLLSDPVADHPAAETLRDGAMRLVRRLLRRPGARWAALAGGTGLVWFVAGIVPAGLASAVALVLVRCARVLAADRRADQRRRELSAGVAALLDEYDAGATLAAGFAAAAAAAGGYHAAFSAASRAAGQGAPVAVALRAALRQSDDTGPLVAEDGLLALSVAIGVAERGGVSPAEVLAGVRAELEADRELRRAVSAALIGPRSSAILLGLLPLVGLAMGAAIGADPARTLLHTRVGLVALAVGVALDLAGLVSTVVLTRRAQP